MREKPFIVAGGGLAGSAFAIVLAKAGAPVLLLEATRGPHHKVCGEFLSAEAQTLLSYLGIGLDAFGATRMQTFRLAHGKRHAETRLPFQARGLTRFRLDEALLEAAANAGAKIVRGVSAGEIEPDGTRVGLRADNRRFEGQAMALATGKHNLRNVPRKPSDTVGFKLHLRLTPSAANLLRDVVQLAIFEGGYIGACLVEDDLASVGWVIHRAQLREIGSSWPAQAEHIARRVTLIGDLLEGAEAQREKPAACAAIPYGYLRRQAIAPNVYALGDQLAVIPSFTGDGMTIALYSGIAAARAVLAGESAEAYQNKTIARLAPQFRWAAATNLLFEKTWLQPFSVSLAAAMPSLVGRIARSTRLRGFEDLLSAGSSGSDSGTESAARFPLL